MRAYGLSLAAAPQKGALRAALLPLVGFCATAQGSASPNPARTSVHLSLLPLRAYGRSLQRHHKRARFALPFCRWSDFALPRKALRARTPPARNHLKIQLFLRACGLSLAAAPKKGALRAALLPPVGFCATAQGSASPNPARTKPPKNPTFLAGLRSLLTTAPKKGAHFDMCSLFWCRWSDSNRHGIATTGF